MHSSWHGFANLRSKDKRKLQTREYFCKLFRCFMRRGPRVGPSRRSATPGQDLLLAGAMNGRSNYRSVFPLSRQLHVPPQDQHRQIELKKIPRVFRGASSHRIRGAVVKKYMPRVLKIKLRWPFFYTAQKFKTLGGMSFTQVGLKRRHRSCVGDHRGHQNVLRIAKRQHRNNSTL